MRIVVTGGAGYLGSMLVPQLLDAGNEVVIFDKFTFGVDSILHFADHTKLEIVPGDIRDFKALTEANKGCDALIHLAAIVGYPACAKDEQLARTTNIDGTRNVADALHPGQRFIFASTGSTYGQVEGVCTEETPINPLSFYGKTKAVGEKMALDKGGVALRYATVFGLSPRLRLDLMVNEFVYKAIHDNVIVVYEGWFRRTFVHVRDAVAAITFALQNYDQVQANAYNIGSDSMNYTKLEVAKKIMELVPFHLYEADVGTDKDARDYEVSYKKINSFGFETTVTLEDGIRELIKVLPYLQLPTKWRNV